VIGEIQKCRKRINFILWGYETAKWKEWLP